MFRTPVLIVLFLLVVGVARGAPPSAPAVPPAYRLLGTSLGADGGWAVIYDVERARERPLRVGGCVRPGVVVLAVEPGAATLSVEGRPLKLRVATSLGAVRQAASPPHALPSTSPAAFAERWDELLRGYTGLEQSQRVSLPFRFTDLVRIKILRLQEPEEAERQLDACAAALQAGSGY